VHYETRNVNRINNCVQYTSFHNHKNISYPRGPQFYYYDPCACSPTSLGFPSLAPPAFSVKESRICGSRPKKLLIWIISKLAGKKSKYWSFPCLNEDSKSQTGSHLCVCVCLFVSHFLEQKPYAFIVLVHIYIYIYIYIYIRSVSSITVRKTLSPIHFMYCTSELS
jgi:hypothetical protein